MTKYEVIQKIMARTDFDEDTKVFKIESYLKGWMSEDEAIKTTWELYLERIETEEYK